MVSLGATRVSADPEIRSSDPRKRNCYFDDEYALQAHEKYSQVSLATSYGKYRAIKQYDLGCVLAGVRAYAHPGDVGTIGKVPALVLPRGGQQLAHVQPLRGQEFHQDHEENRLGSVQGKK